MSWEAECIELRAQRDAAREAVGHAFAAAKRCAEHEQAALRAELERHRDAANRLTEELVDAHGELGRVRAARWSWSAASIRSPFVTWAKALK